MQIRKRKPVRGWRDLLAEVAVVMIGILLALGAEALVERRHWQEEAAISERAIRLELLDAASNSWERFFVAPCLSVEIAGLAEQLGSSPSRWQGMPSVPKAGSVLSARLVQPVYRPPSRAAADDAWQNAIATGTLTRIDADRAAAYASLYDAAEMWIGLQDEEARAATRLAPLAFDGPMDLRMRNEMLAGVAEVDRIHALMMVVSRQYVDILQELRLGYTNADLADLAEIVAKQREARGDCVRDDLPLDLG